MIRLVPPSLARSLALIRPPLPAGREHMTNGYAELSA